MNEWWGYLHSNGTVQVKRAAWTYAGDIAEAQMSPFVQKTFPKFPALGRDDAIQIITQRLTEQK